MVVHSGLAQQGEPMRNLVTLTRYGTDPSSERWFGLFQTILNGKLIVLDGEVGALAGPNLTRPRLSMHYTQSEKPSSLTEIEDYWAATQSLQILQGTITAPSSAPVRVQTRFHLVRNAHDLNPPTIVVDLRLDESQFNFTLDSHSAVILHSLAVEAAKTPARRAWALAMLAALSDKLANIERSGPLPVGLARLRGSADRLAKELRP
jgi:hypothetical protein